MTVADSLRAYQNDEIASMLQAHVDGVRRKALQEDEQRILRSWLNGFPALAIRGSSVEIRS